MEPQPLTDGNGGPPTLAVAGSIKTRCPHCHHEDYWTLVGEQYVCSQCGNLAIVVAATGETIEQAIQAAAQELPDRVELKQGMIPGLRPLFDVAAALDLIEEAAQEARVAEAAYEGAKAVAKRHRDAADLANTTLRDLIRDLAERRHDARYEPPAEDAGEKASAEDDTDRGRGELRDVRDMADGVPAVPSEDSAEDAAPLPDGAKAGVTLTGRAHVINASRDGCAVCGIGFTPYPEHVAGDPFGMNCTGWPEDRPEWLQERLHEAGADQVSLEQIVLWTPEQRCTARLWAEEQIEAHQQDAPGTQTSIAWPEHVSLAHHGPEYGKHTPAKRKKTTRRRSR